MNHSSASPRSPTLTQRIQCLLPGPSLIQKLNIKLMQLVQEKGAVRLRIFGLIPMDSFTVGGSGDPVSDIANWEGFAVPMHSMSKCIGR